ncbi:hypothetical protein [Acetobacter nitrogenifigens]|uniref:hypothetical protein n=1 Tax=Acetobacter nitrogenifigens TaxID=285268 RepID=UPI0011BF044E|nr:hypothetical protein [Acetobacter nitrogenifigens]
MPAPGDPRRDGGCCRRPVAALALVLILAACTDRTEQARTELIGMPYPDLVACAGPPSVRVQTDADDWDGEWGGSVSTPSVSGSVPLFADLVKPTVSASAAMSCRMTARVRGGRVYSIHYVGTSSLIFGAHAACAALVRDCLLHPDHTTLPADYDAGRYLGAK